MKIYAEINNNNIVINTIICTEENIKNISGVFIPTEIDPHIYSDYEIAKIGEAYLDGKFVNGNQAVELGLLTIEEALNFGFHSGFEYKERAPENNII